MLTCLFGSPWCVRRYNSLFSNFLTPGQCFVRWENPGKFFWVDTFSLGLIAETFTYTPINTQKYVYHMDAPASISSECLVLLWYVRYSWPSSNYERRTCTTSVITVKALGIVWRESKNMADGAKTHLALFCLRRTLRYSDRRRHT